VSDLRESLKQSAANRAAMERKFGMVPMSILKIHRGELSQSIFSYQQEKPERHAGHAGRSAQKQSKLKKILGRPVGDASCKLNGRTSTAVSLMPPELVAFFVRYYSRPSEVYLDPFMGQGIRMQVAKKLGLHYYGYDLSSEFFAYIDAVRSKIDDGKTTIQITCGDSKSPDQIPDGIGDFSFHSPPYWDIEFYGTEEEQLGYQKTYSEFIEGMEQVARAWLPKFKKGAWHVVNVNDFRKDGRFYPYHADTIGLFQRAGWMLCDTWIIDGLVGGLSRAFAVDFNLKRIAPKVHEYCLVFRKP